MGDADVFGERIAVAPVIDGPNCARGAALGKQDAKQDSRHDSDAGDGRKMRQSRGKSPRNSKVRRSLFSFIEGGLLTT